MKLSKQIATILMASDSEKYAKFLQPDGSMIVVLQKCVYGLREAPPGVVRIDQDSHHGVVGFRQSEIDTCVFYKKHDDGSETFVALYVDDMLVVGTDANIEVFGKSHSGFCLFPDLEGSAAILYKSLKQKTVTKSSTESELVSLKEAVQQILICAELLMELDTTINLYPIIVYQDN